MDDADLVTKLFRRAEAHGVSIARVCRYARIAPTTPSRWRRRRNGATLDRVARLHAALDQLIREDAEQADRGCDAAEERR